MRLATDARALRYSGLFSKDTIDVVPSATVRGRTPWSLAYTARDARPPARRCRSIWMRRLKPAAVVGFGGYLDRAAAAGGAAVSACPASSTRPMRCSAAPTVSRRAASARSRPRCPACSIAIQQLAAKATTVGTPMRPAILAAATVKFASHEPTGPLRLLVVGGSQGARVMADIVPGAIERLETGAVEQIGAYPAGARRKTWRGCARSMTGSRSTPNWRRSSAICRQRLASSHLVISRSGAGTVAELGAIGRPSILVPLPGAIDQDQFANAGVLTQANGALRIVQADFTPDRLAAEISALAAEPARLTAMAGGARAVGRLDAADRLADLVMKVAGI